MPLSGSELFSDVPDLLALALIVEANVSALPAKPGAEDYARCAGASDDGAQMMTAKLVDRVLAMKLPENPTAVDYARLAGAAEIGPEMSTARLIDKIKAQAASTP